MDEHTTDGDVLDAPWLVFPISVEPVAGSATSTQSAKTCGYVALHNYVHCTDKDCCLGQMG